MDDGGGGAAHRGSAPACPVAHSLDNTMVVGRSPYLPTASMCQAQGSPAGLGCVSLMAKFTTAALHRADRTARQPARMNKTSSARSGTGMRGRTRRWAPHPFAHLMIGQPSTENVWRVWDDERVAGPTPPRALVVDIDHPSGGTLPRLGGNGCFEAARRLLQLGLDR